MNTLRDELVYDLAGNVIVDLSISGGTYNWLAGYVWAGGRHVATYTNSTTYFSHEDWLGTERVRTDVSGNSVETCTSNPYGDSHSCTGAYDWSPYHFAGMYRDWETGFYYTPYRYYNPSLGSWMTPDPAGLGAADSGNPQSLNRYAYVMNNPLRAIDPLGLDCVYLNDNGTKVEELDAESDPSACWSSGGYWADGTVGDASWVTIDPNSDNVWITSSINGFLGNTYAGSNVNGDMAFSQGPFGFGDPSAVFTTYQPTLTGNQQPGGGGTDVPLTNEQKTVFTLAYQRSIHDLNCVGLGGLIAGGSVAASRPVIPKAFSAGGTSGTSVASILLRGINTGKSIPTPVGTPGTSTFAWRATADLGGAVSRWLPYIGMTVGAATTYSCLSRP